MATYVLGDCESQGCTFKGDVRVIKVPCCKECCGYEYLICDECYDAMMYGED